MRDDNGENCIHGEWVYENSVRSAQFSVNIKWLLKKSIKIFKM